MFRKPLLRSPVLAALAPVAFVSLSLAAFPGSAGAAPPKKDKDPPPAAPAAADGPPMTKSPIKVLPDGVKWDMDKDALAALIDKFIDEDYKPKYQATTSPVAIKNLDAEVATKKQAFRRSEIKFEKDTPTGLDSGPLALEYTKGNGESVMSHHRGPGVKIWFFFIGGRLRETYEEVSFVQGGLYGKDMTEGAGKLVDQVGGTLPHPLPADPDHGRPYDSVEWQDAVTYERAFDRSGTLVIIKESKSIKSNLPNLRRAVQPTDPTKAALDPSIAAVLRGKDEEKPLPPPPDPKDKKKKLGRRLDRRLAALVVVSVGLFVACKTKPRAERDAGLDAGASAGAGGSIDVTDAGPEDADAEEPDAEVVEAPAGKRRCPPEMVLIGSWTCVDRWEASLVDKRTGQTISPYYPVDRKLAIKLHDEWDGLRLTQGSPEAQAMPVPALPAFEAAAQVEPMAVSRPGVTPNGYLHAKVAEAACERAGKRLCKLSEWRVACEGKARRPFPYGDKYQTGKCNIFRNKHPAAYLHDDASRGHLDPRLDLVKEGNDPLLRPTGGTPTCRSEWGDDAIYDMNGNIDEWVQVDRPKDEVDDPATREYYFVGGFFSRGKKDGCASIVKNHPKYYFDYSIGTRCCLSVPLEPQYADTPVPSASAAPVEPAPSAP